MLNLFRFIFLILVLLGYPNLSVQQANAQDITNPEFSKMDQDQNGQVSSAEMQAYQAGVFDGMDANNDGQVSEAEYSDYARAKQLISQGHQSTF